MDFQITVINTFEKINKMENFQQIIWIYKKYIGQKNLKITKFKNSIDGFNKRLGISEERIVELEYDSVGNIHIEVWMRKRVYKRYIGNGDNVQHTCNEEDESRAEAILKKIMTENCQQW